MAEVNCCYVYVYEFDGVVRYVGEGRNSRMTQHRSEVHSYVNALAGGSRPHPPPHRFYSNYAKALLSGCDPQYRKIAEGLTKANAVARQDAEIARYPREQLWNTILATHPRIADEEVIARMRDAQMQARCRRLRWTTNGNGPDTAPATLWQALAVERAETITDLRETIADLRRRLDAAETRVTTMLTDQRPTRRSWWRI